MAARNLKIRHDEETRAKIKTSQLLNRLQDHAFDKCDMSATQIRAAEICLRKTIPDLTATEIQADIVHRFAEVPQVMEKAQWLATRGDPAKLIEHQPADPSKKLN